MRVRPSPTSSSVRLRWVRPPRQDRSTATLHRILDATEALLEHRSFEELSVVAVVRRARTSVGSFYARFTNKDKLLAALYDRHQEEAKLTAALFEPIGWQGRPLAEIVARIVSYAVAFYRRRRGLLRALVLQGYARPDWRYRDPSERSRLIVSRVAELVGTRGNEISHPNPKMAAGVGFLMVLATIREKVLFGESTTSAVSLSDSKLARELTRAYLAYLGVRTARTESARSCGSRTRVGSRGVWFSTASGRPPRRIGP